MTHRFRCITLVVAGGLAAWTGSLAQSAAALDTPNTLMAIDAMVMTHQGLFRNGDPHDGFNTFQFGAMQTQAGTQGRYRSFYAVGQGTGENGGVSHNARFNSNTPQHFNGIEFQTVAPLDITNAYYPVIDRAAFGQRFEPSQYQIEVKFKPNLSAPFPVNLQNQAVQFSVGLDQQFGFVWDAEANTYKRSAEQNIYNIGNAENPINTWYASAPKDADGFATWVVPVTQPSFTQRSFYHNFGDNDFRNQNVVTGGGRTFNAEAGEWQDVTIGFGENYANFGGGVEDPARPGSKLNVINGVPLISFGKGGDLNQTLSVEIKHIALTRINPGPIAARIDANSGLTFRFGGGFERGQNAAPIPVPNDPYGLGYVPVATDQISRFDQNGMTNLMLNMRTPDDPNQVHRFILRGAPNAHSFDGTDAVVNVRARLLEPLTNAGIAQSFNIVAKDLDGNDMSAMEGADEYTYTLALNQFNTSTFTTVSIPLSQFTRSETAPFGFTNLGNNNLADFNLYEFGGLIPSNGGALRIELEYLEIRLPATGLPGDFDGNALVDGHDFLLWQRGQSPNPMSEGDLNAWRTNYLASAAGASGAVPEPGCLALTGLASLLVWRRRG